MKDEKFSPVLYGFCGPVASGKSSICTRVAEVKKDSLCCSISTTTRAPREGEVEGEHYFFVSKEEFHKRVDALEFIEHAQFGSQFYGTERKNIELAAAKNKGLILDIDIQGIEQLKKLYPGSLVTIFVFPPSFAELESRLLKRGTEDKAAREERLTIARHEVKTLRSEGFSDYLIVNDDLDESVALASSIIDAERIRYQRYSQKSLERIFSE